MDINLCKKLGVTIARRFTGGGAVYHDEGNLNFTILSRHHGKSLATLQETNSSYIVAALQNLGLRSECVPPNSVYLDGRKIAGAACALNSQYALWHASILLSTNTSRLRQVLSPSCQTIESKYVRSKWSQVTTLNEHLLNPVNAEELSLQLTHSIRNLVDIEINPGRLSEIEEETSKTLYTRKYRSLQWNLHGTLEN